MNDDLIQLLLMAGVWTIVMILLALLLGGFGYGYLLMPVTYNIKTNEGIYNNSFSQIPQQHQDMVTEFKNTFYGLILFSIFPIMGMIVLYALFNAQRSQVQY